MNPFDLLGVAGKILDKVIPDPVARANAQVELLKVHQAGQLAQIELNKTEAAHTSVFVSGWRPFIGWVCGTAFAFQFVAAPLLTWAATLYGNPVAFPSLDMGTLLTLLLGMLGLGGMRTAEKVKGVAAK